MEFYRWENSIQNRGIKQAFYTDFLEDPVESSEFKARGLAKKKKKKNSHCDQYLQEAQKRLGSGTYDGDLKTQASWRPTQGLFLLPIPYRKLTAELQAGRANAGLKCDLWQKF